MDENFFGGELNRAFLAKLCRKSGFTRQTFCGLKIWRGKLRHEPNRPLVLTYELIGWVKYYYCKRISLVTLKHYVHSKKGGQNMLYVS